MKRIFLIAVLVFGLGFTGLANAETVEDSSIYIFTSPTCPHCTSAKEFLNDYLDEQELDFEIKEYNISKNTELAESFYIKHNVPNRQKGLVPAIFIGDRYFIGFSPSIGNEIGSCLLGFDLDDPDECFENETKIGEKISLPILGEIDPSDFSLPLLAIVLGVADGFNVCSLGALMVILGLVVVLGSRKRIIFLGGAFLITTALVYGLLVFLWHQFFSFVAPYIRSFEFVIGLLAFAGGIYLLREFYKSCKSGPVCSSNNLMSRLTPKIEKIFESKTNWAILLGVVVVFATLVTIIEFPCSAFLPVIFTSILVDAGTSMTSTLTLIGIYLFFYLLDEAILFLIAVFTMKIKIVSSRFIIFFNLLAALVFIFLGVYYLFGWLS